MKMSIILLAFITFSCVGNKSNQLEQNSKSKSIQSIGNEYIKLTGLLIQKKYADLSGKRFDENEWYLRCSVQDYFIKFCESEISKKEIDNLYVGEFEAITIEVKIKNGNWDDCTDKLKNRNGKYIILHKIIN